MNRVLYNQEKNLMKKIAMIVCIMILTSSLCGCNDKTIINSQPTEVTSQIEQQNNKNVKRYTVIEDITNQQLEELIYVLTYRANYYTTEAIVTYTKNNKSGYIISIELPGIEDDLVYKDIVSKKDIEFITNYKLANQKVELTGKDIKAATAYIDKNFNTGASYGIKIEFTDEGGKKFAEVTAASVGKPITICYDGDVISSPTVQSPISGGEAVIANIDSFEEAENIASFLNAGTLEYTLVECK